MEWAAVRDWFLGLGRQYGVNPVVFGAIYVGAIPFFSASVAWLVRDYRRRKSIVLPALSAGLCFVSAYLYLIVAGRNVPLWVYAAVIALIVIGALSTARKIRRQLHGPSAGGWGAFGRLRFALGARLIGRSLLIALAVGFPLSLINQGNAVLRGPISARLALKLSLNFVIPFFVTSAGAAASYEGGATPAPLARMCCYTYAALLLSEAVRARPKHTPSQTAPFGELQPGPDGVAIPLLRPELLQSSRDGRAPSIYRLTLDSTQRFTLHL